MQGCLCILQSSCDLDARVGEGQSLVVRVKKSVIESGNPSDVEAVRASAEGYGR